MPTITSNDKGELKKKTVAGILKAGKGKETLIGGSHHKEGGATKKKEKVVMSHLPVKSEKGRKPWPLSRARTE